MARTVLLRVTGSPRIDYHMFFLFDVVSSRFSVLDIPKPQGDAICSCGNGGAVFATLGEMTDVEVEFVLWNEEPDWPEHPYQRHFEGSFTADTGQIVLCCVTGSPEDVMIELPVPGPFRLRAFRDSEPTPDPDFPDMVHHDEQWLIHAWPDTTS